MQDVEVDATRQAARGRSAADRTPAATGTVAHPATKQRRNLPPQALQNVGQTDLDRRTWRQACQPRLPPRCIPGQRGILLRRRQALVQAARGGAGGEAARLQRLRLGVLGLQGSQQLRLGAVPEFVLQNVKERTKMETRNEERFVLK